MNKQTLTAGQTLVRLLANYGVETVFGIPGVHTLELYRGLPGSGIRHVLTRHEQGAGFMADGYARATGKPGVCFLISGPGVTNAATAIGQAYADSIPLLVISSVNNRESLGQGWGCLHECKDQRLLTEAITSFSAIAMSAAEIPELIARAFAVFGSERPRPVHLSIPMDVLAEPVDMDWSNDVRHPAPRPAAPQAAILEAIALIGAARRPVMIVGGGAVDAAPMVQKLAEHLQAQVFSTVSGKGILAANHPLYAGSTLCMPEGWQAVEQADLVVAIGTEMAETDFWRERLTINAPMVRIDIDPSKFTARYASAVALCGDAGATLTALLYELPKAARATAPHTDLLARVERSQAPLQSTHLRIIRAIEAVLPERARIASDMTQLAYSANYLMQVNGPRRWLHPTGYGTLGYGVPAGIGAQIACPDDPVLVLVGDGGILYTLTELATAQEELSGSLVVLLWNNEALGQIRDDMLDKQIEPIGVLPRNPNFCGLARDFGCVATRPASLGELQLELTAGFRRQGVTLIELTPTAVKD
jgi:5-guanidino-2-oxopentanoate decarboxylase